MSVPPRVFGGGYQNTGIFDPNNLDSFGFAGDVSGRWYTTDLFQNIKPASAGIYGPTLTDRQGSSYAADPSRSGWFLECTKGNVWESQGNGFAGPWTNLGGTGLVGGGGHPRGTGRACWYLTDHSRVTCFDQGSNGVQILSSGSGSVARTGPTTVAVNGSQQWKINGSVTHPGASANGLMVSMRMVNAIFDDLNSGTVGNWKYPNGSAYDPARNTTEFCNQVPYYAASGVDAVTISLTGGRPVITSTDPQSWDMCAFNTDGSIPTTGQRSLFWTRLDQALTALDNAGIVCILQLFYFGEVNRLTDDTARNNAMTNLANWITAKSYRGVIFNVANEVGPTGNSTWSGTMFDNNTGIAAACDFLRSALVSAGWTSPLVGITYGSGSTDFPANAVVGHLDWVGLQNNSWTTGNHRISNRATSIRALSNYIAAPIPILVVEDQSIENLGSSGTGSVDEAISSTVSPNYYEKGLLGSFGGGDYATGFQCVPPAWGPNSNNDGGLTGSPETNKALWFTKSTAVTSTGASGWQAVSGYPGTAPQGGLPNPANPKQCFIIDSTHCWRVADITAGSPTWTQMTGLAGAYELVYDATNDQMLAVQGQTVKRLISPWSASAGSSWTTLYTGDTNFGGIDVRVFSGKTYISIGGNPYNTAGVQAIVRGQSSTGFLSDNGVWDSPLSYNTVINGSGATWQLPVADTTQGLAGSSQSFDTVLMTASPSTGKLVAIAVGHAGAWICQDFTATTPVWSPAVNGLGGEICRAVAWDIRDNKAAIGGISDHGAIWSPSGLYDQHTYLTTTGDSESIVQDPVTFSVRIAYSDGTIKRYSDPSAGNITSTDEGVSTGGAKNSIGLIYNGSNQPVLLVATRNQGVQKKVGTGGSWSAISALGTPTKLHNPFATDPSGTLLGFLLKGIGVYVSTDFGTTWTLALSSSSTDDHAGSIFWGNSSQLYYSNASAQVREIVAPWATPTVTDVTGTLPANLGLMGRGSNGHVTMVLRATSSLPNVAVYTSSIAALAAHAPNWTLVADTDGYWANIGAYPLDISVSGNGSTLVSFDGMGIVSPEPLALSALKSSVYLTSTGKVRVAT